MTQPEARSQLENLLGEMAIEPEENKRLEMIPVIVIFLDEVCKPPERIERRWSATNVGPWCDLVPKELQNDTDSHQE